MAQSKADSFSAFLEAKQRSKPGPTATGATALTLLGTVGGADQKQMPLQDLMSVSGMAFAEFADALKSLKELGYLTLTGPPGSELANLTPLGEEVSRLSRPA